MGRRRVMPGSDYRAAMYGTGDVRVGASGRVWLRKRILLGLAGAALIGAAAWLLILMRPPDAAKPAGTQAAVVQCLACGDRRVVHVDNARVKFPIKCARCGERACQRMWECRDCGNQFVPRDPGDAVACPKCGSRRVGSAEELRPDAPPVESR